MKFLNAFFVGVLICGTSSLAMAATNGPAAFLRKMDRQFCANFNSQKCNHHKRRTKAAPKSKTIIEKPLASSPAVQPHVKTETVPKPTPKPEISPPNKSAVVLPRPKPVIQVNPTPLPPVIISLKPSAPITIPQTSASNCLAALKAKNVEFASVPQPLGPPSCLVSQPVQLNAILVNGVKVQLPDKPILNCNFALSFATWMQELGGPAAIAKEGSGLTQFWTGPGYQCRGRNGDISAKISEHGFGNAIDVERLKFSDGLLVFVRDAPDATSPGYEVLKAIRASACQRFTTVLGPGSNEAHREHFHFDSGAHGKSGTYRICE